MTTLEIRGKNVQLNGDGHLASFHDWNEEVAKALAEQDSFELQECHWEAIRFAREYYAKFEVNPSPRAMIKEIGGKLSPYHKCTKRSLEELFPNGGCKQACRLAGLPAYFCQGC